MKICYIADQTCVHTKRWLSYFSKAGHEIFLIPHSDANVNIENINILQNLPKLSYKSGSFFSTIHNVKSIINNIKPDILHAHFIEQYGWLGAFSNFHPLVMTAWGTDIFELPYASRLGVGKKLTQYAMKKADLLTAISEHLKSAMIRLNAKKEKIEIIHWGVDLSKFRYDMDVAKFKQELRINNQIILLSNRNFENHYNIDCIVEAMPHILKKEPNTILILQNAGGELEKKIRKIICKKRLKKSVRLLPRFAFEDMPKLYAIADIFISVPSWDAASISLTEAMACCAVPVISAINGPMEWVQNDYNGKVVPIRDPEALGNAIYDLIANPTKRKKFAEINLNLAKEKADQSYWMNKMNNLYESLHMKHSA